MFPGYPQLFTKKTKPRRPPEHHNTTLQQFSTKTNPLVKKLINNTTTLEFSPKNLKKI